MTNSTRVAVVTGAGRGIGLAIVRALVDDGVDVVAGSRTITAQLRAATPDVVEVDLTDAAGPARLIDHVIDRRRQPSFDHTVDADA